METSRLYMQALQSLLWKPWLFEQALAVIRNEWTEIRDLVGLRNIFHLLQAFQESNTFNTFIYIYTLFH